MGTINGVPAHEYSIETTEEKPWLKPGADITGKILLLLILYNFGKCIMCHRNIFL